MRGSKFGCHFQRHKAYRVMVIGYVSLAIFFLSCRIQKGNIVSNNALDDPNLRSF